MKTLSVSGAVAGPKDFVMLRKKVSSYDWPKMDDVFWNVRVVQFSLHHQGFDSELFLASEFK